MTDSSNTTNSLAHTKWNCKYHIVFAPKYRRKVFYEEHTVGKNTKAIQEYVANQLKADKAADQLSLFDPRDPLTGSK